MKLKRTDQGKYRAILEEIDADGEGLTAWEINFIESLTKLLESTPGFCLTKPQMVKLENIHSRRVP